MNVKLKNLPIGLIVTAVILLFVTVLFISAQMTMGRYLTSFGGEIGFAFNSKQSVNLSKGAWSDRAGQKTLSINLSNAGDAAVSAHSDPVRVRIFVPKNVDLSDVKIKIGSREYVANISSVPVGTAIYNTYGEGNICRFFEISGEELALSIPSSGSGSLDATLTLVSNSEIDTTGIEILAEPAKKSGNGGN